MMSKTSDEKVSHEHSGGFCPLEPQCCAAVTEPLTRAGSKGIASALREGSPLCPAACSAPHPVLQAFCVLTAMFGNRIAGLEVNLAALLRRQRHPAPGTRLSVLPR